MSQQYLEIPVAGERIAAMLHRPATRGAGGAAPLVVCCHGFTGTRIGTCGRFVSLARRLAAEGVACLRFDFRGCGESDGRFQDVTVPRLVEDLTAVMAAAGRLEGCDAGRVGIVASSVGAFTTSMAAGRIGGLRCVVLWAPVADVRALALREMTDAAWDYLRRTGWVDHRGLRLGPAFFDCLTEDDAPARLAAARVPTLIFHGAGDAHVPIEHSRAYRDAARAAGGECELCELDTSDHGMRTVAANDAILDGTVGWMRKYLSWATV